MRWSAQKRAHRSRGRGVARRNASVGVISSTFERTRAAKTKTEIFVQQRTRNTVLTALATGNGRPNTTHRITQQPSLAVRSPRADDLRISVAWGRYRRGLPAALRVRARESRRPCESESSARRGVRSSVGLGATRVPRPPAQVLARPTSRHGGAMSPRDRCPGTPREPVPRSTRRPRPFPLYMQVLNQSRVRSDATQCRSDPSDLDSASARRRQAHSWCLRLAPCAHSLLP